MDIGGPGVGCLWNMRLAVRMNEGTSLRTTDCDSRRGFPLGIAVSFAQSFEELVPLTASSSRRDLDYASMPSPLLVGQHQS